MNMEKPLNLKPDNIDVEEFGEVRCPDPACNKMFFEINKQNQILMRCKKCKNYYLITLPK